MTLHDAPLLFEVATVAEVIVSNAACHKPFAPNVTSQSPLGARLGVRSSSFHVAPASLEANTGEARWKPPGCTRAW